jgi:hypothetical protein
LLRRGKEHAVAPSEDIAAVREVIDRSALGIDRRDWEVDNYLWRREHTRGTSPDPLRHQRPDPEEV